MVVYYDKKQMWLYRILPSLVLVAMSLFLAANPGDGSIWFGLILAIGPAGFALWFAARTHSPRPRMEIDEQGVNDRQLGVGLISWEDIRSIGTGKKDIIFVSMSKETRDEYLAHINPFRRSIRVGDASLAGESIVLIKTQFLTESQEDIAAAMIEHHSRTVGDSHD